MKTIQNSTSRISQYFKGRVLLFISQTKNLHTELCNTKGPLFVSTISEKCYIFVQLASKKQNYTVYFAMPQSEYWLDPSVILSSVIPAHLSGSLPIYIWA